MPTENVLPNFRHPPVFEVALAVHFRPLKSLNIFRLGEFWSDKLQATYPTISEVAPLTMPIERFGEPKVRRKVRVEVSEKPPAPRLWASTHGNEWLVQLQGDMCAVNWRGIGENAKYPRYAAVRERFRQVFSQLNSFVQSDALGTLAPRQCEITYINHILAGAGWERFCDIGKVFKMWSASFADTFLPEAENTQFLASYVMPGAAGENQRPSGRMRIAVEPRFRMPDKTPMFHASFSCRGTPQGEGLQSVLEFMDLGHEWIVRGFAGVTTEAMHNIWERIT